MAQAQRLAIGRPSLNLSRADPFSEEADLVKRCVQLLSQPSGPLMIQPNERGLVTLVQRLAAGDLSLFARSHLAARYAEEMPNFATVRHTCAEGTPDCMRLFDQICRSEDETDGLPRLAPGRNKQLIAVGRGPITSTGQDLKGPAWGRDGTLEGSPYYVAGNIGQTFRNLARAAVARLPEPPLPRDRLLIIIDGLDRLIDPIGLGFLIESFSGPKLRFVLCSAVAGATAPPIHQRPATVATLAVAAVSAA